MSGCIGASDYQQALSHALEVHGLTISRFRATRMRKDLRKSHISDIGLIIQLPEEDEGAEEDRVKECRVSQGRKEAAIESRPERVPRDLRDVQSSNDEQEEAIHSLEIAAIEGVLNDGNTGSDSSSGESRLHCHRKIGRDVRVLDGAKDLRHRSIAYVPLGTASLGVRVP